MNNSPASRYMDKQVMDLSNSQSNIAGSNGDGSADFIDFMNRPAEKEKDNIAPSYNFMPIRPAAASSSPKAARSNFDSDNDDPPPRTWNSLDSKINSSPIRNYNYGDVDEPAKLVLGKNLKTSNGPSDGTLVSDIERMMMKHMDTLMHAVDNMSSRLSQLETRTRNLEHSIDDLKISAGNNNGAIDGKMRLLENILTEVQSGVKLVRDKQEIVEAQMQIAKLQTPKAEHVESKVNAQPDTILPGMPTNHQFSSVPQTQASPALPPPNTPPPPPQQNIQSQLQHPNQFPQSQIQKDSYFPPPSQNPENQNQQCQLPPMQPQQEQLALPPPPRPQYQPPPQPQHQYQPPPQPQYSQPPPPSQPHSSFSNINPSMPQPPIGHHPEETLKMSTQNYSVGTHPPPSVPPTGVPPPAQQYYGPTPNTYDPPPASRPGSGYSNMYGPPPSGHGEPYPYSSSQSQYDTSSHLKPQQLSSPGIGQRGGSGYQQLPTARILPQALPTASAVGGSGGSGSGSGNRVPIDDVVDRVTNMGFSRDQVRATVRKLTENGQAVDFNIVLDKLMNDGEVQAPRGWFGRLGAVADSFCQLINYASRICFKDKIVGITQET